MLITNTQRIYSKLAGEGTATSSSNPDAQLALDGLPTSEAKSAMLQWLETSGKGRRQVNYKLRDWLFARQRYWGEPFPVSYPEGSTVRFSDACLHKHRFPNCHALSGGAHSYGRSGR